MAELRLGPEIISREISYYSKITMISGQHTRKFR